MYVEELRCFVRRARSVVLYVEELGSLYVVEVGSSPPRGARCFVRRGPPVVLYVEELGPLYVEVR